MWWVTKGETMPEKNSDVAVTVMLPVWAYRIIEAKATKAEITAGRLLAAFIVASLQASVTGASMFVVTKRAKARVARIEASRARAAASAAVAGAPKRPYVRITDEDIPVMKAMIAGGALAPDLKARFGISYGSARNWWNRLSAQLEPDTHDTEMATAA